MNLTALALKRPITTLMFFSCCMLVGIVGGSRLLLEQWPAVDIPQIFITIPYANATPSEIERLITQPAEEALATMGGIKRMRSFSEANQARINLDFDWGQSLQSKGVEAREKLDAIRHLLPVDVDRILVFQPSTGDMPIMRLRISSQRDLSKAYDILERHLKRPIERIEGVSKVSLYGVNKNEIRIKLDASRISARGINIEKLVELLDRSNFAISAGEIEDNKLRYQVSPVGEYQHLNDIRQLIIGPDNLRLEQVAEISLEPPRLDHGRHLNQSFAIGLDIEKQASANLVEVSKRVMLEIDKARENPIFGGISMITFEDQAQAVTSSLSDLLQAGLIGALLSVLVLYFFLRQLSTTLVVALSVPCALLITLAAMYFIGLSLNILSMMGLMLAVGMLVDNAVVVSESIFRERENGVKQGMQAAVKGVNSVSMAVMAGTLTTVIVFLPNIVGEQDNITVFLKHMAVTICISLGASLLIAQTLIPLLISKITAPPPAQAGNMIKPLAQRYRRLLAWTLDHPRWSGVMALVILLSVGIPGAMVSMDMFPEDDSRQVVIRYHLKGQYQLEKVENSVSRIEKFLYQNQQRFEIDRVYSYFTSNTAITLIWLTEGKLAKRSMLTIRDEIKQELPALAIAAPTFGFNRSGSTEEINIRLSGDDTVLLLKYGKQAERLLKRVPELKDVLLDTAMNNNDLHIVVDRQRARLADISPRQVAQMIGLALRGKNLRTFRGGESELNIRVEFSQQDVQTLASLKRIQLFRPGRSPVALASIADFTFAPGFNTIYRLNRQTSLSIKTGLKDATLDEARTAIKQALETLQLPPGYRWHLGQAFNNEDENRHQMLVNMLLAVCMIYLVMAALFESLSYPAAIITAIIYSVVGVYWFFLFTQTTFSLMAMIGVLVLMGIVVNNGIVLVDHINRLRNEGLSQRTAILTAGEERVRPILMTVTTTILAMVPLAMGNTQLGGGGLAYYPMARAVIGGLLFSTLITLVFLPTFYVMLDHLQDYTKGLVRQATFWVKRTGIA